jgi:hypothetical protein
MHISNDFSSFVNLGQRDRTLGPISMLRYVTQKDQLPLSNYLLLALLLLIWVWEYFVCLSVCLWEDRFKHRQGVSMPLNVAIFFI